MKIGIASDHHGVKMKKQLIRYLEKKGNSVINYGTDTTVSVDYPEYAFKVGKGIQKGEIDLGILICGTGIGMSIACNKMKGIRCAKVNSAKEAFLTREHNHANVMALSSAVSFIKGKDIVDAFLKGVPSEEERHIRRIEQIDSYEE